MEVSTVVAVVLSAIAGLLSAFTALRQRRTEDATLVVGAQRDHMQMLIGENNDLRERLRTAEGRIADQQEQIGDMRVRVAECDSDKNRMKVELHELQRRVRGLEDS